MRMSLVTEIRVFFRAACDVVAMMAPRASLARGSNFPSSVRTRSEAGMLNLLGGILAQTQRR